MGGSPPLARGTASEAKKEWKRIGITPACAGNRNRCTISRELHGDHPRLRGEQPALHTLPARRPGSPPLARGTGARGTNRLGAGRITPACAGNSLDKKENRISIRDHPRLRGEQALFLICRLCVLGSPPLARGTDLSPDQPRWMYRITPACAGNSCNMHRRGKWARDHPRLRGEQQPRKECAT